jgi:hypothetical protein
MPDFGHPRARIAPRSRAISRPCVAHTVRPAACTTATFTPTEVFAMHTIQNHDDPHAQLRALYFALLTRQENFDEFKQLLALYDLPDGERDEEPRLAGAVRARLNERIEAWIGGPFRGLSAVQVLQWRSIVVEDRLNVSLSPWKESNLY